MTQHILYGNDLTPGSLVKAATANTLENAANGDVTSVSTPGGSFASGDIVLEQGTGIVITQTSGSFSFVSTGGVTFASIAQANAGTATNIAVDPAGLPLRIENAALIHNQPYGGNTRGSQSVDLQYLRGLATQVASGVNSVIGGGRENTASADSNVVAGGELNTNAGQTHGVISGGYGNEITTSGNGGVISGGYANSVSAELAAIPGGGGAVATNYGQFVHSSGEIDTVGDAQGTIQMVLRREIDHSSDTGWQDIYLDGTSEIIAIPTDTVWTVDILVSAADSGLTSRGYYRIVAAVSNLAGTTQIDAQTVTTIYETTSAWDVQMAVANDNLLIQVTDGTDSELLRWVATVRTCELTYPAA